MGFSESSVGKESACNAGDPNLIPGLGYMDINPSISLWTKAALSRSRNNMNDRNSIIRQLPRCALKKKRMLKGPSQAALAVKTSSANGGVVKIQIQPLDDPLEKEMATHSSFIAWRIPCVEKPGRLQSRGSHRARHNWSDLAHMHTL